MGDYVLPCLIAAVSQSVSHLNFTPQCHTFIIGKGGNWMKQGEKLSIVALDSICQKPFYLPAGQTAGHGSVLPRGGSHMRLVLGLRLKSLVNESGCDVCLAYNQYQMQMYTCFSSPSAVLSCFLSI